ncbi:hypothetical protein P0W64_07240 [Tsukamurella sp. 8F]|uniref:hypothetical protein n=1 Tax=unclassified Tsukamurella TaxID=2633480 RepID=UPI0023B9E0E8|nr:MULTISPECIES: hypothetical protein [unclassified Tsukamurella]MDF0530250.1 hypothetical protein [Tsukamurella sp. 8J]MDF0586567.1 hypothetical protein [Tsukamurella sp. 8F]
MSENSDGAAPADLDETAAEAKAEETETQVEAEAAIGGDLEDDVELEPGGITDVPDV